MSTFSTYSLVNLAIVREWSLLTGLVDIIEGMLITGIACTVAFYISQTSLIIK
jgi:uncharacterized membrane protein